MCGIAGIVAARRLAPGDADRARRMAPVMAHRGPDESGFHLDDQAALAHRRLSIIDLAAGQQPIGNEDRSIWIVYNGEIYNHAGPAARTGGRRPPLPHAVGHRDHRARLRAVGRRVRGPVPRHVRLRDLGLAAAHGSCWPAIASASSRSTGRAPATAFSSRRRSRRILETGLVRPEANEAALPELLATRYLSGSQTMFAGVRKLLPGHILVFEDGDVRERQYLGRADRRPRRRPRPGRRPPGVGVPRTAGGVGPAAADERRAARGVPLGRHRLQRRGGDDGGAD